VFFLGQSLFKDVRGGGGPTARQYGVVPESALWTLTRSRDLRNYYRSRDRPQEKGRFGMVGPPAGRGRIKNPKNVRVVCARVFLLALLWYSPGILNLIGGNKMNKTKQKKFFWGVWGSANLGPIGRVSPFLTWVHPQNSEVKWGSDGLPGFTSSDTTTPQPAKQHIHPIDTTKKINTNKKTLPELPTISVQRA